MFSCSKSMETIDSRGVAKFDPRGPLDCHIPSIKAVGPVVSEKKIFDFYLFIFFLFSIKTYTLSGQPEFLSDRPKLNMQPFRLPCEMLCVCYLIKIHQRCLEILMFECFPIESLCRLSTPGPWPNLTPGS